MSNNLFQSITQKLRNVLTLNKLNNTFHIGQIIYKNYVKVLHLFITFILKLEGVKTALLLAKK